MPTSDEAQDLALYYWPTPNGYKATILLEELGLTYQLLPINITQGDQHTAAYVRQVPTRKIPALRHQNTEVEQVVFDFVVFGRMARQVLAARRESAVAVPAMAVLAGWRFGTDGGATPSFSSLC